MNALASVQSLMTSANLSTLHNAKRKKKMLYLVQPPAQSIEACDPLFTYALSDPIPSEISMLKNFQNWGWEVSVHFHDDATYLNATKEVEKAIKTRRRRTQMIHGDMVGDIPRLTLEELWQRETTKRSEQELYKIREKEEINDAASIMSRMTEQRAWVRWADKEAELEVESPNVDQAINKQFHLPHIPSLEDCENSIHICQGPAGSLNTSMHVCNVSRFIGDDISDWHVPVPHHSLQRAGYQPVGQQSSSFPTSSTSSSSPKEADLLMDPHPNLIRQALYFHHKILKSLESSRRECFAITQSPRGEITYRFGSLGRCLG
ncbi:hypothetical protein BKA58DRAFT_15498 [Alternaria rosae]|uniref:uncharacterized protein n=1 Tax=Alternaria rosae TaxID=1187941 RepID=UPI001E8EF2F3|nr:uncharacterized protein BKA58DRAFT_15498 [Alternaria rosae]KAH6882201.1 hypothetical protein BKA58DRAFT_15498 [Alternaria rosae]